tara:strand:+ start:6414 stop:7796 length:1383 start_codon:yes stop_codon:yes gene_type:complete
MSYIINEILSGIDSNRADIQDLKSIAELPENDFVPSDFSHPDFEVCYSSDSDLPIGTPVRFSSFDSGDVAPVVAKANTANINGLATGVVVKSLQNGSIIAKKNNRVVGLIDEDGTTGKDGSSEVPTDHYAVGRKVYATDNTDDATNMGVVVPDDDDLFSFDGKYILGDVLKTIRINNPVFGDPGEPQYLTYIIFTWAPQLAGNDSLVGYLYNITSGPDGSGHYSGNLVDADGTTIVSGLSSIRAIGTGTPTVPDTYPGGIDPGDLRWFFFKQATTTTDAVIESFSGNAVIYDTTPPAGSDPYINGGIIFSDDSRVYFKLNNSITISVGQTKRISVSIGNAVFFNMASPGDLGQIRVQFVKETFDVGTITWANQPTSFTGYSQVVSGDVGDVDDLVIAIGPLCFMQDISTAMTIYGVMVDCVATNTAHCAINQHQIDAAGGNPGNPTEEAHSPNAVSIILP